MVRRLRFRSSLLAVALALAAFAPTVHGQGSLVPPDGPPGPTMKSLQEIWDQLATLDATTAAAAERQDALAARLEDLSASHAQTQRFLAALVPPTALGWRITTVGPTRTNNRSTSLAFAPDGRPAVAYPGPVGLHLARFDGEAWHPELVYLPDDWDDPRVTSFPDPSLGFGPDGLPVVAHLLSFNSAGVATFDGVYWFTRSLGNRTFSGTSVSLAHSPQGVTSIAVSDPTLSQLFLYTRVAGTNTTSLYEQVWERSSVDQGQSGFGLSLVYGPDGQPAVSYVHQQTGDVFLARFDGTMWTQRQAAETDGFGLDTSLAFGPDGHPAIAFGTSSGQLSLARFNGTAWSVSPLVQSVGSVGTVSLAFGPDGQPAIAFQGAAGSGLRLARFDGSSWSIAVIDGSGNTGHAPSLAFGPDGFPVIAYIDETSRTLKVARQGLFPPQP